MPSQKIMWKPDPVWGGVNVTRQIGTHSVWVSFQTYKGVSTITVEISENVAELDEDQWWEYLQAELTTNGTPEEEYEYLDWPAYRAAQSALEPVWDTLTKGYIEAGTAKAGTYSRKYFVNGTWRKVTIHYSLAPSGPDHKKPWNVSTFWVEFEWPETWLS